MFGEHIIMLVGASPVLPPTMKHDTFKKWTAEEDALVRQLQDELGADQWTAIASRLGRTPPSVRNRFSRNQKAAELIQKGKAKNRCTNCRQYLMGSHVCLPAHVAANGGG